MSGIAGIYYLDGRPVEQADLQRMLDTIAHRGPDGSGVWVDGSVGLGHAMLWTTPESLHERLPLVSETGEISITADARIDNQDEFFVLLPQLIKVHVSLLRCTGADLVSEIQSSPSEVHNRILSGVT